MENPAEKPRTAYRALIICGVVAAVVIAAGIVWRIKHTGNASTQPGTVTGSSTPSSEPAQLHNTSPSTSPCPNDAPPLALNIGGQVVEACSQPVDGTVTAVSAASITVTPDGGGAAQTFAITSDTKITQQGATLTAGDIKAGDTVSLIPADANASQAWYILVNPHFQ